MTDRDPLVVFTPSGKRGRFPVGTPLLSAARTLGVDVDSVCGGRGICGRCQVLIAEGEFAKHGVRSGSASVSPLSETEQRYAKRRGLPAGHRLSCSTLVRGDVVVDVPPGSQVHRQVVRKDADARVIELNPVVRLHYVEVREPDMHDPSGDLRRLYEARSAEPWKYPTSEIYLLLRAGLVMPVEAHTSLIDDYADAARASDRPMRDNCRVVLTGMFCEQPPLGLIKSIEMAGCYVVDDDFMLVTRWLQGDVPTDGEPLQALSRAFLHESASTAAKYDATREEKGVFLMKQVKTRGAEGVIFAAPSFCDPALLERPMLQDVLSRHGIPHTAFKYAENTGQMAPIREQAGTFADSIKLWSAA